MTRCEWAQANDLLIADHDQHWGVPIHDDGLLFQQLILEGAQAGLSWSVILQKKAAYKAAFDDFNPSIMAEYDKAKIQSLMQNSGIVRNKLKINLW